MYVKSSFFNISGSFCKGPAEFTNQLENLLSRVETGFYCAVVVDRKGGVSKESICIWEPLKTHCICLQIEPKTTWLLVLSIGSKW